MKKPAKRAKAASSKKGAASRRKVASSRKAAPKSKPQSSKSKTKSARTAPKSAKTSAPKARPNLKTAVLAAGAAAVQTALGALSPEKKNEPDAAPEGSGSSGG
jgi:hypothetical protein